MFVIFLLHMRTTSKDFSFHGSGREKENHLPISITQEKKI